PPQLGRDGLAQAHKHAAAKRYHGRLVGSLWGHLASPWLTDRRDQAAKPRLSLRPQACARRTGEGSGVGGGGQNVSGGLRAGRQGISVNSSFHCCSCPL